MMKWSFPSRSNGVTEGFSNPGHAMFKGDPLQALAREICQNSLDAVDYEDEPVRIEFKKEFVSTKNFPGTEELLKIMKKCQEYWKNSHNEGLDEFLKNAIRCLDHDKMFVLRISDFNTIGLQGAFDTDNITPWVGLVKSTGVNVKSTDTAAGSYGIGKAAAFINSDIQTVFYRTKDLENNIAAQGVANLMAFSDESYGDEDPVRRATGFYGNPDKNLPVEKIDQLDEIYKRTSVGTDIFIPGFHWVTSGRAQWVELMIGEILENFLMSIYYGRLCVQIENNTINKSNLSTIIARNKKSAKNAYCFNKILCANEDEVVEENYNFHGMGNVRLRLIYTGDLNKKILVVRNSGMKIAEIKSLPKGIAFSGILELQGDELNKFFRKMENPQHNSWDPQRHDNPEKAKNYKLELEKWVKDTILRKVEEESGEETTIDVGDCFNSSAISNDSNAESEERVVDTTKSVEISFQNIKRTNSRSVGWADRNKDSEETSTGVTDVDSEGTYGGTNGRAGTTSRASDGGEKGGSSSSGGGRSTKGTSGRRTSTRKSPSRGRGDAAKVRARVIEIGEGKNKLFITSDKDLPQTEMEVVTVGENGKSLSIQVQSVLSDNATLSGGKIIIKNLKAGEKTAIDFTVSGKQNYAMGVRIYGN